MSAWFQLPARLFSAIDASIAWMPALCRLLLWSLAGGALCTLLYKWTSPQRRLNALAEELRGLRAQLDAHTELDELMPLVRQNLRLSFIKFALTLGPALLGAYPGIAIYLWMGGAFAGQDFLAVGPHFLRGWQAIALSAMLAVSLTLKVVLHIR